MTMRRRRSRFVASLLAVFLLLASLPLGGSALAASPALVISQVYGGGGNSGAYWRSDFVELFNSGSAPVDVTGWSVQYASSAGTTWGKTLLSGTIQPGQYYLVKEADGANTGAAPLPTPDATGTLAMSGSSGKVALVNHSTTLSGSAPTNGVVDFVGYGLQANYYEGAGPTPTLTNSTAAIRAGGGCTDTDQNNADFATGEPTPRNSSAPLNPCEAVGDLAPFVSQTSPANAATEVAQDASITITFNEPVAVADGWFSLVCSISGSVAAESTGGPSSFTLTPAQRFAAGERCAVVISAEAITDLDETDPPDSMAANYTFSFTVVQGAVSIHDIQGAAHLSPLVGQSVRGVPGIVTHVRPEGFFMEEPEPDADPATSEGIYVFTKTAPRVQVGDEVVVSGKVSEFRPGGSSTNNLTITEITSPSVTVRSSGNPLPPAVILGLGGRPLPTAIIEDDATGNSETTGQYEPESDGIDFWESLESMRVQVNEPQAVGLRNRFAELWVLADGGQGATGLTPRGGIAISADDFNPERVMVDADFLEEMGLGTTPAVSVGDRFTTPIVGIVDYSFSNFKVQALAPLAAMAGSAPRVAAAAAGPNQLAIGTFNVENLDANDPAEKYAHLAGLFVNNLKAPDLVAVEEIQDNNGPVNDGTVDASLTWERLIEAIAAAGGPQYQYRDIAPVDGQDGGEGGGNIRVGFLFRTDRGLQFIDRPGGTSTTGVSVIQGAEGPELSASPGRIDPTNSAFQKSRKPLAGEFIYNNQKLFVVANHFNSKGGDDGLYGRNQPPNRKTEAQRHQQAAVVGSFVQELLTADPQANVVVLGDLNDFQFSETLSILKNAGLKNPMETLPAAEQYTYVFEGNSQALDHILFSENLFTNVSWDYEIVHVNAEYADQASDHDPQLVRLSFAKPDEGERTGSATGGGWIKTPAKANFGFNLHLGEEPKGQVQFHLDGLKFHGDQIIEGTIREGLIQFEGTGRMGREGGYTFEIEASALPGEESFRIQIRRAETGELVYDSGLQPLGGGSIQIHEE